MILKFLFNYDKGKRKILSGIVEDDSVVDYDPSKKFMLAREDMYKAKDNETISINKGKTGYLEFEDENGKKYLDVNIYNDEVVIQLTTNISHASCYSMDFYRPILDYAMYFGYEEPKFIYSGLSKESVGFFDDYTVFKAIKDASYCKINKNDTSYFVSRDLNQNYYLSKNFEDASKINKNELRRVLIINGFINKNSTKADVSFSPYKYLSIENSYIYAGRNPYKLSFDEEGFEIELNPIVDQAYRLRDVEDIFLQLKDISYLLSKEKSDKNYYLETTNFEYIKKISDFKYKFVKNPFDATLLNDYDIEIIKSAYKLIDPRIILRRKSKNYYMYSDKNLYTIYDEAKDGYEQGRMVDNAFVENYKATFDLNFNTSNKDNGTILIHKDMYLNIEYISKNSFKVLLTKSAYNASLFTKEETKAIKDLLGIEFSERRIENVLLKDLTMYNIRNKKPNISENYRQIMKDIFAKKTPISDYTAANTIKTETEKGALEYLRRFYLKSVYDYKELFEKIFNIANKEIKKVLIIAPKLNLELQGLELACKNNVEVYTLNELKSGYYPAIDLEKVDYKASYRLKLQNVSKQFIESFDVVLFGAAFNENVELFKDTLDEIISNNKNIIFANSRIIHAKDTDYFYEYFKNYTKVNRTYYTYEFPYKELVVEYDEKYVSYLLKSGNRIHNDVSINKNDSYFSIIKKKND